MKGKMYYNATQPGGTPHTDDVIAMALGKYLAKNRKRFDGLASVYGINSKGKNAEELVQLVLSNVATNAKFERALVDDLFNTGYIKFKNKFKNLPGDNPLGQVSGLGSGGGGYTPKVSEAGGTNNSSNATNTNTITISTGSNMSDVMLQSMKSSGKESLIIFGVLGAVIIIGGVAAFAILKKKS